eukprot:jgi/Botrbrau1/10745/Bobra.180_2s0012.1
MLRDHGRVQHGCRQDTGQAFCYLLACLPAYLVYAVSSRTGHLCAVLLKGSVNTYKRAHSRVILTGDLIRTEVQSYFIS